MQLQQMREMVATHQIREGILKPASEGNGWQVGIEDRDGIQHALTDHGGHEKLYHSIDVATETLRDIGVDAIKVVE